MKKKYRKDGFTVAELLICLTVMAIIAVLSISAMMSGYEKRTRKAYFGKIYSEIVTAMYSASRNGCNANECGSKTDPSTGKDKAVTGIEAFTTLLDTYMTLGGSHSETIGSTAYTVYELADGTYIKVPPAYTYKAGTECNPWLLSYSGSEADNSCTYSNPIIIDVNGKKEPNRNFSATDAKQRKDYDFDQMNLYLYKSTVMYPAGAKYVFEN